MDTVLTGRPSQTTIRKLRFVSPDPNPDASAAVRWLEGATLEVPGLAPGAILCVRRLPDPLAGKWRPPTGGLAAPPLVWRQAVAATLHAAARQAARPAEHAVPAGAEAVLFGGTAELLACLASDWLSGSLVRCWWWHSLFGPALMRGATPALVQVWLGATSAAPGALALLERRRLSGAFVQALPSGAIVDLLAEMVSEFKLVDIKVALDQPTLDRTGTAKARPEASPPWSAWTPEGMPVGSERLRAAYLGIGLGLVRAPAAVRRTDFAHEVAVWLAAPASAPGGLLTAETVGPVSEPAGVAPLASLSHDPGRQVAAASHSEFDPGRSEDWRVAEPGPVMESWAPSQVVEERAPQVIEIGRSRSTESHFPPAAHTLDAWQEGDAGHATAHGQGDSFNQSGYPNWPSPAPASEGTPPLLRRSLSFDTDPASVEPEEPAPSLVEPRDVVHTAFGGVFYLINLGLYLGLYGDFSTPLQPGLALGLYDFVALVADGLWDENDALHADAVWPLLARLAGRSEDDPPGAGFAPPDGSSLALWLDHLLATVRDRLVRALGLSDEDRSGLPRLLLAQAALVSITPTRLDVTMSLDEHPIQIRLSGLDRDPGWVPAAGRFVAYHFE